MTKETAKFWIGYLLLPVLAGLFLWFLTNRVTAASVEQQTSAKFVELAVGVLNSKQSDKGLRAWAAQVLSKYSPVPIDERTRNVLVDSVQLSPFGGTVVGGGGGTVTGGGTRF